MDPSCEETMKPSQLTWLQMIQNLKKSQSNKTQKGLQLGAATHAINSIETTRGLAAREPHLISPPSPWRSRAWFGCVWHLKCLGNPKHRSWDCDDLSFHFGNLSGGCWISWAGAGSDISGTLGGFKFRHAVLQHSQGPDPRRRLKLPGPGWRISGVGSSNFEGT